MVHFNHSLELLTKSRALTSQPRVIHIIHNPKLFIESRTLSSRLRIIHVLYNSELFKATRALSTLPKVVHVIVDPQFCPLTLACILGVSPTPNFLYGMAIEPLLSLIDFWTSREFTYGWI